MLHDLESTGFDRIVVKTSQDSAIIDFIQKVKEAIMIEQLPAGDSQVSSDAELCAVGKECSEVS